MAGDAARAGTGPDAADGLSRAILDRRPSAARGSGATAAPAPAPPPVDLDRSMARDYADVVAAVRLISGDRSRAEEAVQDALVALVSRPPAEPLRSASAWVTVVASNAARSHYRRTGLEQRPLDRVGGATGPASTGTASTGTASTGTASTEIESTGIESTAIQDDEIQDDDAADRLAQQVAVRDAIGRLPLGQRQVCVMH
ncbi:sigma factor [Cellulomonas sp. KRMCY2]|uniref:sigma factor n=1 Tax=Cellulomonas sp. KRMCY2 TaxID=1304865 RepID=UPI00045E7D90|nr:sigma factor [Cellulomonas sp. KRMCY2]